jgi:hypothetical protein
MYHDFDDGLAGERAARIRAEIARNRLEAHLTRANRSDVDGVARGAALVTALFR